jgi:hypothetical protein
VSKRRACLSEVFPKGNATVTDTDYSPAGRRPRPLLARFPSFLGRRWLPAGIVLLALLVVSPALTVGPLGDDFMLMARVDPAVRVPGFPYAPLDLFTFASGDPIQGDRLREEGVFGWWMAPDFRMAFWRPLSSLTHLADHRLWGRAALPAHVHSLLWFVALLTVLASLYRRFHPPWIAHLALLLYAVDDARAWVVGWIANRNALVAATFAFAALVAYDRARRDGWRAGAWLAPPLFAAGLLGGEAALGLTGYLLAYALFVDSGSRGRRLARLWPYAALSVAWLVAYKALGYGTRGGGMYLNPLDEPIAYLRAAAERLPVLLAAQVGLSLSDFWLVLPPPARIPAYGLALLLLAGAAAVVVPVWRRVPACRFWVLGAVLSLPPVCATFPMDRLLVFAGVGAFAATALFFAEWLEGNAFAGLPRAGRAALTAAVSGLALAHLLLAPLLLPGRILALGFLSRMGTRLETSIPRDEAVAEKALVILSSAAELTTFPAWMRRHLEGIPHPRSMRVLASCAPKLNAGGLGTAMLRVSRPDTNTLRVRAEDGFLDADQLRIVRGLSRPFHEGDEVVLSDMRTRVREVTPDGRPAEVDFRFRVPLEDPSLLWMQLHAGGALAPWSLPAVGQSWVVPAIPPASTESRSAGR